MQKILAKGKSVYFYGQVVENYETEYSMFVRPLKEWKFTMRVF